MGVFARDPVVLLLFALVASPAGAGAGVAEEAPAATARRTSSVHMAVKDRTCLKVATFNYTNRSNVYFMGKPMPLKIAHPDWASAVISAMLLKIISEEVLGVHAEGGFTSGNSQSVYLTVAACKNPQAKVTASPYSALGCCGQMAEQSGHVAVSLWRGATATAAGAISEICPNRQPYRKGSMGFEATDSLFVRTDIMSAAYADHYLPLEYYVSYSNRAVNLSHYFDTPWTIRTDLISRCDKTRLHTDHQITGELYHRYYGAQDPEGVVQTVDSNGKAVWHMNCSGLGRDRWWPSPRCRADPSQCIAVVTGGNGWKVRELVQKATAHNMPVAVGVASSPANYMAVPLLYRTLFYWWWPDAMFTKLKPLDVIFPKTNAREWLNGDFKTEAEKAPIDHWAAPDTSLSTNTGFQRILGMLDRFSLTSSQMQELLELYTVRGNTDAAVEGIACDWLNNNTAIWLTGADKWIPEETTCEVGQGLKSELGEWVSTRKEAKNCAWCSAGRMSKRITSEQTYKCDACPTGRFQATLGAAECVACGQGEEGPAEGLAACTPCPSGTFGVSEGRGKCEACPPGFVTAFVGSRSADDCVCQEEFYRSKDDRAQCLPCKQGMDCPAGSDELSYDPLFTSRFPTAPKLKPGMWSSLEAPLEVFACADKIRCPGNTRAGAACAPRLENQACAHCEVNYAWDGEECEICGDSASTAFLFPTLPIILTPVLIIGMYKGFGDTYQKWGSWRNGCAASVFILINFFQVVNIIRAANIIWPKDVASVMDTFKFTGDVTQIFRPDCAGFSGLSAGLLMRSLIPLCLAGMYALTWGGSQIIRRCLPSARMEINRTLNGFFSLIFTFFAGITEMALTVFKCTPNPNGTSSLQLDRSITCGESEWSSMLLIGILAVVFWCVGFGLLFVWAIYSAPHHFHDKNCQMRWKFLFIRYRPDVHWWAVAVLAKGIVLSLGSVFLTSGAGQLLWLVTVLSVYMCALAVYRPWRHMTNNYLDGWAHCSLMSTCTISVWYAHEGSQDVGETDHLMSMFYGVFLFICLLPVPFVLSSFIIQHFSQRARDKKEHDVELMLDAFAIVVRADEESRVNFLDHLSEWDFWFMVKAKDVIHTYLVKRKCRSGYSHHRLTKPDRDQDRGTFKFMRFKSSVSRGSSSNPRGTRLGNKDLMIVKI